MIHMGGRPINSTESDGIMYFIFIHIRDNNKTKLHIFYHPDM